MLTGIIIKGCFVLTAAALIYLHSKYIKYCRSTGENKTLPNTIFVIGYISALAMLITVGIESEMGYKRGQIDALTGHIKYELKTQPDRSVEWEEITTYVK